MATDGQVDTNEGDSFRNKMPPFAKNRMMKKKPSDQKASARKNAIQERLAKMSGKRG